MGVPRLRNPHEIYHEKNKLCLRSLTLLGTDQLR